MIAEVLRTVLIGLVAASLLGAIIGYIVAYMRANKRSNTVAHNLQTEWGTMLADAERQIEIVNAENKELTTLIMEANVRAELAAKNEESTALHSKLLSKRIHSLESQASSYEEQQIRLQRDFAAYKSPKTRELELACIEPDSWPEADQLPVLKKRIERDDSLLSRLFPITENLHSLGASSAVLRSAAKSSSVGGLDLPFSQELDIPELAESELPDSVEELEFELADWDVGGGKNRG